MGANAEKIMKRHLPGCDLLESLGRTHIPIPISEVRAMATKVKGSVTKDGKFKAADTTPKPLRKGKAMKAARKVAGLRKNREAKA